jgi:hypothetical protein
VSPARRLAAVVAVVAALPLVAGCAVGVDAPTNVQGPSGDGAAVDTGSLQARGLILVQGDLPGQANLIGTVVNVSEQTDDAITAVTVQAGTASPAQSTLVGDAAGTIALPARSAVQIGYDAQRRIEVSGLTAGLGHFTTVTISYKSAGTATVSVLTVPATGIYADLGPSAAPVGT